MNRKAYADLVAGSIRWLKTQTSDSLERAYIIDVLEHSIDYLYPPTQPIAKQDWTTELPTEPGWYWVGDYCDGMTHWTINRVMCKGSGLVVCNSSFMDSIEEFAEHVDYWSGPLTPPPLPDGEVWCA